VARGDRRTQEKQKRKRHLGGIAENKGAARAGEGKGTHPNQKTAASERSRGSPQNRREKPSSLDPGTPEIRREKKKAAVRVVDHHGNAANASCGSREKEWSRFEGGGWGKRTQGRPKSK